MAFQCLHRSQMSSRGIQRSAGPTSRQSEDGAQKSILRVLRKDPTARLRKLESACSSVSSGSTQGVWRGLRQFQFPRREAWVGGPHCIKVFARIRGGQHLTSSQKQFRRGTSRVRKNLFLRKNLSAPCD